MLDIRQIMETLPHRFPFLFVDRIVELVPGRRAVGVKNVSIGEGFFQGHFPGRPIMPGVLIIEAMAQVAGAALLTAPENERKNLPLFAGIERARFRRVVTPGDQLYIEADVLRVRGSFGRARCLARVEQEVAAQGDLLFVLREE